MKTLDQYTLDGIQRIFKTLLVKQIAVKLKEQGKTLTDKQISLLEDSIKEQPAENFSANFYDYQSTSQPEFGEKLTSLIGEEGIEKIQESLQEASKDFILSFTAKVADIILKKWKEQARAMLKTQRARQGQFKRKIGRTWGTALDLLEMLQGVSLKTGAEFNDKFRPTAPSNDFTFEALTRLHARGCQVAAEILVLLNNGFADGAHARWRTLNEISVIAYFIDKHGNDAAERYLNHSVIHAFREAEEHQKHYQSLHYERIPEDEFRELEAAKNSLVDRFGKKFDQEYGWASNFLSEGKRVSFTSIAEDVNFEHMRLFIQLANANVHGGSRGIEVRLGLPDFKPDLLLAGPSIYGLDLPGQNMAISLNRLNAVVFSLRRSTDTIAFLTATKTLVDEIFVEFSKARSLSEKS